MNSETLASATDSATNPARPSTHEERHAMQTIATRLDDARHQMDCSAAMEFFAAKAVFEFKPAGIRITSMATIKEMFRRSMPGLAESFSARSQLREWSNQNGLLREWSYPVRSAAGNVEPTIQLEIIEFAAGLERIASYRIRANRLFSRLFVQCLGDDFTSLPGVERIPG